MSDAPAADTSAAVPSAEFSPSADRPSRRRRVRVRSFGGMVLQVVLIALGVFLGLAGEEWRNDRDNRSTAAETLRRFRVEIAANRDAVMAVKDYHAERHAELEAYFDAPAETRDANQVNFAGLRPLSFEQGAWELAIATGSLAYIDPELAFLLSQTYADQSLAMELGRTLMGVIYRDPPPGAGSNFFATVRLYYGDMVGMETGFIVAYDVLIAAIDAELAK
jgi:hypothetical protein